jgi:LysR family hydrogen peroxide-inducible transcriptional activator
MQIDAVTLKQLQYIVTVAHFGHFGHAADACFVTQPTLSMQVQKAEQQLGVVIFDRTQLPIVPTEVGERVIAQARVVLREAARLVEICEDRSDMVQGSLRVGVLPTLAPYVLPRLLPILTQKYPGLQVQVEEVMTELIVRRLREETLDIGLIATPALAPDILQWPLFVEPLYGYVHSAHTLAGHEWLEVGDILSSDVWLLREAHCFGQQTRELCRISGNDAKLEGQIRFESGSIEMLKQMVEFNGGLTLLPALSVSAMSVTPASVRVVPFSRPAPSREVSLVSRRAFVKQHLIEAFVRSLLSSLPPVVQTHIADPMLWRLDNLGV